MGGCGVRSTKNGGWCKGDRGYGGEVMSVLEAAKKPEDDIEISGRYGICGNILGAGWYGSGEDVCVHGANSNGERL